MRLDGSCSAVVTGAGSGIGAALARDLDQRGVKLALTDIDGTRLEALSTELDQAPLLDRVDVADGAAMGAFAERVLASHGPPDLVVANAGVSLVADFLHGDPADWDWLLGINLWGVIHTNRAFAGPMASRGKGTIVNISSLFGLIGVPNCSAYCASKAAVRGFSESIQQELREHGVNVMSVHPGGVATNIARDGRAGDKLVGQMSYRRSVKVIARGMPPERAAAIILRGVEKGRQRVLVGRDAWLLDKLQRLFPVGYRAVLRYGSGLL